MRRLSTTFAVLSLTLPSALLLGADGGVDAKKRPDPEPPQASKVALELKCATPVVAPGSYPKFIATLTNTSAKPVTVVLPGDGSDCGWRTPVVTWTPARKTGARCGNVNALQSGEVVTLAPGKSVALGEWLGNPSLGNIGKHKVTLTYENNPAMKFAGIELGKHDPKAMEAVRNSTPVKATSNVVEIEVRPAKAE